jgi:hypothetical protein
VLFTRKQHKAIVFYVGLGLRRCRVRRVFSVISPSTGLAARLLFRKAACCNQLVTNNPLAACAELTLLDFL